MERTLAAVPVVVEDMPDSVGSPGEYVVVPAAIEVRLAGARTPVTAIRDEEVRAVVPWASLHALPPGEGRVVPIELHGVPALVRAFSGADSVRVQRRSAAP